MCLTQLGVRLDGYQSGAILLFRGAEMKHFVAPWEGIGEDGCRYAFDHTTHESVRKAVMAKKEYPEYKKPDFSEKMGKEGSRTQSGLTKAARGKGKAMVKPKIEKYPPTTQSHQTTVAEAGPSKSIEAANTSRKRKRSVVDDETDESEPESTTKLAKRVRHVDKMDFSMPKQTSSRLRREHARQGCYCRRCNYLGFDIEIIKDRLSYIF